MKKIIQNKYFTLVLTAVFSVAFLAFLAFNPSHAYFQVDKQIAGINTARVDLLFDKFNTGVVLDENGTVVDLDAEWGTYNNPYVMTGKNHVNNLFILQKSKYFANKTTTSTVTNEDGTTTPVQVPRQSFFRVANKDGTPIVIDCDEMNINPIGTPDNPFTGNIQGAPGDVPTDMTNISEEQQATYKYNGNSVSVSAIANLNVIANEDTPDIGFFGRLGYNGTVETVTNTSTDDLGNTITSETLRLTGFAASLDNLLFADITITTTQSPGDALETWWNKFIKKDENGNNVTDADGNVVRNDYYHTKCGETHHLGIIAGHAEWSNLSNISIYYSEDVPAFDVGADTTNYYSIVGLLGTLSYVNPPAGSTAGTVIAVGSISDEQLNEDLLSGGGGQGSGMLTGYMLAENIFIRKDDSNQKTTLDYYAEAYDIRTLTEKGESLFTVRTMSERLNSRMDWTYRNYYYFADTIFTFAMTTSVASDSAGNITGELSTATADYLIKIWETNESNSPITKKVALTETSDKWVYEKDSSSSTGKYLYALTAVDLSTLDSIPTVDENGNEIKYVLAYNASASTSNPSLYVLDMFNPSSGYALPIEPYTEDGYTVSSTANQVTSLYVLDTSTTAPSYAFLYNLKSENHDDTNDDKLYVSITSASKTNSFGLTAKASENYANLSFKASTYREGAESDTATKMYDLNAWAGDSDLFCYGWDFAINSDTAISNDVILTSKFTHYNAASSPSWRAYSVAMVFDSSASKYDIVQGTIGTPSGWFGGESSAIGNRGEPELDEEKHKNSLLLFKIEKVSDTPVPAKNFITKEENIKWEFDPSTDVLFCEPAIKPGANTSISTEQIERTKNYIVTPLISKRWNNGKGQYLSSLNHAVKLAEPNLENFQMNFSGTLIENWFGDVFNSNTGGVVLAPLGTTGVNFTLPTGTIAFYINKASANDPSTINIIVAVGPGDGDATIGLFGPQDISQTKTSFKISDPYQAFALPVSRIATSSTDKGPLTHISGYYSLQTNSETGAEEYVLNSGTDDQGYYTYLGGGVVFVGCTFEVTEPGVYLLAPTVGKMSVAYFSVDGAAGSGGDGTGGSPLGDIDFVYDNGNNTILTVDKKFTGSHVVSSEDLDNLYYPSYFYIRMIPAIADTSKNKPAVTFPSQELYIRRYIVDDPPTIQGIKSDRRRVIKLTATDPDTKLLGLSAIYQDIDYDTIDTSS